jgi:hypothetical protein
LTGLYGSMELKKDEHKNYLDGVKIVHGGGNKTKDG